MIYEQLSKKIYLTVQDREGSRRKKIDVRHLVTSSVCERIKKIQGRQLGVGVWRRGWGACTCGWLDRKAVTAKEA